MGELLPMVEAKYGASTDRKRRFVQGFSMGGFGASMMAFKHHDQFAAAVVWDGAMHDWETLSENRASIASDQFNNDERIFDEWSPWALAANASADKPPMLIVSGMMLDFADRYTAHLRELGLNVTRHATDCGHDLRCLAEVHGKSAFAFFAAASR
jgi:dienelactone hydrolase